jgi:hypothetical protein
MSGEICRHLFSYDLKSALGGDLGEAFFRLADRKGFYTELLWDIETAVF